MYYEAEQRAKSNGAEMFHLAAILWRGKSPIRVGTNCAKTHPKFGRKYKDGTYKFHLHAEMDVLRFARPGDRLEVMRWRADGELTMSKPCKWCIGHIKRYGISEVRYTDWDGKWQELNLRESE